MEKMGYTLCLGTSVLFFQMPVNLELPQIKESDLKKKAVTIFGFAHHKVSVATTHLC